ncbi:MAG: hypothetical protein HY648_09215 [Acidobacteria bacterium]|nr:hypothetical protein [Acidobacteriota bacterium]
MIPRIALLVVLVSVLASPAAAQEPSAGGPESKNMELVGMDPLQGRDAYQPTIHRQGSRWVAYVGLHAGTALNPLTGKTEGNGTMVVDVTDPRRPQDLAHIPGIHESPEKESQAQMARVCDIAGGTYLLRSAGSNSRHELWNVTDPSRPQFVTVVVDGLKQTHKNWWECDTGIAYLVSGPPDWRITRMMQVYDLSNPAKPVFIRNFGLDGMQPGSTGPLRGRLHGMISYNGRVYMAWGSMSDGVVQILDREKLLKGEPEPTTQNLLAPQIGRVDMPPYWGAHTTYPMLNIPIPDFQVQGKLKVMDILAVTSEGVQIGCGGQRHLLFFLDITNPATPWPISNFQVPESSGDFCERGGAFGTHSVQESFSPIYYKKILFVSHFSAGVRAVDVRDPFHPVEAGFFIPAITKQTKPSCEGAGQGAGEAAAEKKRCKTVIQTNNVEVDERGYVYTTDRAGTGLHIFQLTGSALAIVDRP